MREEGIDLDILLSVKNAHQFADKSKFLIQVKKDWQSIITITPNTDREAKTVPHLIPY